jgi:site-specific DNA-methyltransferase (adenine-specific)
MSIELNQIYVEDCLDTMAKLDNDFIDLVVTSPPYDNLRSYQGYSFDFDSSAIELYRVLKPSGVLVWVVADATIKGSESGTSFRQALFFLELGFNLHDTMIFAKNNPIPLTHNRYEQQFEFMFVFSKGKPKTFNPILKQNAFAGQKRTSTFYKTKNQNEPTALSTPGLKSEFSIANNIWFYSVGGNRLGHPAVFPEKLAEDHILSWSNRGDVVYDPFMGSGTTAKMAKLNGRHFIGSEISQEYADIAKERLSKIGALA